MKGDITLKRTNGRGIIYIRNRFLAFKKNAPFTNCISKINNVLIDNAEVLDIVMPMYNLLEYSKNYRKTTGSLSNYYRDEPNNPLADNCSADPITNSESFKYKSSILGKTSNANQDIGQGNKKTKKNLEIVVPLKYLSNFWRSLDMPLINCEISLTLTWSKNCVLINITIPTAAATQGDNPAREIIDATTNAIFQITDTNYMCQLLLYQQKMIIIFWNN